MPFEAPEADPGGPGGPSLDTPALHWALSFPFKNFVIYKQFPEQRKFSPRRPPGQLQARLTQVSYVELLGAPHCVVK